MMEPEVAVWLGELLAQAVVELPHRPGLTVESREDPGHWLQIIPEESECNGALNGFVLNFPYRGQAGNPLDALQAASVTPPPDTQVTAWEDGGYATLWVRPDVPLVGLAHFAGDILEKLVGAGAEAEITVQLEYGY